MVLPALHHNRQSSTACSVQWCSRFPCANSSINPRALDRVPDRSTAAMRATQPQRFCGLSLRPQHHVTLCCTSFRRRCPLVQIGQQSFVYVASHSHTVILFSYCSTWPWHQTLPQQTSSPSSTILSHILPYRHHPSPPCLPITMHQPPHLPANPGREPDHRPNAAYDSNHHPPIHRAAPLTVTASFPSTRLA